MSGEQPQKSGFEHGFTLLEVLIAFFVFSVTIATLTAMVSANFVRLSQARDELEASRMAEELTRELLSKAEAGELPELGVREDSIDPPEGAPDGAPRYVYRLEVEPFDLPRPEGVPAESLKRSPLFSAGRAGANEQPGILRRAELRVFREDGQDGGVERAEPFVVFLTEPPAPGELAGAASQNGPDDPSSGSDTP